jgi:hypothetical protein
VSVALRRCDGRAAITAFSLAFTSAASVAMSAEVMSRFSFIKTAIQFFTVMWQTSPITKRRKR